MFAVSAALSLLFALSTLPKVHGGWSNVGITTCNEGNNNILIPQDFTIKKFGTLRAGDMELRLDGFCLPQVCTPNFKIGVLHNISLDITDDGLISGSFFKGFLIRVSGTAKGGGTLSVTNLMTPMGDNIQESPVCGPGPDVTGLTHTNDNEKTSVVAKFKVDEPFDEIVFDVTAVVQHDVLGGISEYYYERFTACATDFTDAPSMAPSPMPTTPPPTPMPVVPATAAPVPQGPVLGAGQPTGPAPTTRAEITSPTCSQAGKGKGKGEGGVSSEGGCLEARAEEGDGKGKGKGGSKGGEDRKTKRGRRALRRPNHAGGSLW